MSLIANDEMRVNVRKYLGHDVLCLHAICQPIVSEMQDCIRFQRAQLDECAVALNYVLTRIKDEGRVRNLIGCGTETYERLTAALASAKDRDVDALRDHYIQGSASIHRERYENAPDQRPGAKT